MTRYKAFIDVETSGTDPLRNSVLSLACCIKDYEKDIVHEFYEECRPESLTPNYQHPTMKGFIVETWSSEAEKVHGFNFKDQSGKQHPQDMLIKFIKYVDQISADNTIHFIYHANAMFDWRFLKAAMYKTHDKLYYAFLKRFNSDLTIDTMTQARAYIKANKEQLKLIDANEKKLTKPRKTKLSDKKKNEWKGIIKEANKKLRGKVLFEGYSLDKLCKGLDIPLDHHNALSDARALIPIHEFFNSEVA